MIPIIDNFTIDDGEQVAVAVSGGPDSMALCWLLSQYAQQHEGIKIHALTVDHGLRPEASQEAETVQRHVLEMPCVTHEILTLTGDDDLSQKGRIMEKARDLRYRALADYCASYNISKLYVAHHNDDQAETILFRLAKGSGLDGLAGMIPERQYTKDLKILRPFLSHSKRDLMAICKGNNVAFVDDPSNKDEFYARPRLRAAYDILAAEGLTPKRLAVTGQRLLRAREALDFYAGLVFEKALIKKSPDVIKLDYNVMLAHPAEIQLRAMVQAFLLIRPEDMESAYGPRTERVENLVSELFLADKSFRKRTLGGAIVSRDDEKRQIILEKEKNT